MEWKAGLILRIKNYKFEDDGTTRDKYAIVLWEAVAGIHYGCSVHQGIPYYFIPAKQPVGDENFHFEKDTFIFFQSNIRKESFIKFEAAARTFLGVVSLGVLTGDELARIIKCALKSRFIPGHLESVLSAFKATL